MADDLSMTDEQVLALVTQYIQTSGSYSQSSQSDDRTRAIEYFFGEMTDVPADENRSSVTSRDLSDLHGWMMPHAMRVFGMNQQVVLLSADTGQRQDIDQARLQTAGLNKIFKKECAGYKLMHDAIHDAYLHGNGIIKAWYADTYEESVENYTGLTDDDVAVLLMGRDVEVLEHSTETMTTFSPEENAEVDVSTHDIRLLRRTRKSGLHAEVIPLEDFIIRDSETSVVGAKMVGHRRKDTRSTFIAEGLDEEKINSIPAYAQSLYDQMEDDARRRDETYGMDFTPEKASEEVEIVEIFACMDVDGDGYAEWRRLVVGGAGDAGVLLVNEPWDDEHPFSDICPFPFPHTWRGRSLFDELEDIQKIKTTILRQSLDSLYWSNNPIREVVQDQIVNMDALYAPRFGEPLMVYQANSVRDIPLPFVAGDSFNMLGYLDQVAEKRTGISRATQGLDPGMLQNQTATAVNAYQSSAQARMELGIRTMAEVGFTQLFDKLLKLVVRHQDLPFYVEIGGAQVEVDPRDWRTDFTITMNIGLGTGTRERDMTLLETIMNKQQEVIGSFGPENTMVTPQHFAQTLERFIEAAGVENPSLFIDVAGELPDPNAQGDPSQDPEFQAQVAKTQAELQLKRETAQAELALKKEQAQAEHALKVEQMQLEGKLKLEQMRVEAELKMEQLRAEVALKREMGDGGESSVRVNFGGNPG